VGAAVAAAVDEALGGIEFSDEPTIASRSYRTEIHHGVLGYDEGVFPYPNGALYCSGESDCDPSTIVEDLDRWCFPFPEEQPAPDQTMFTVGQVGDLFFVTFTGEPVTTLAEYVMEGMKRNDGVQDILFLGYTQDYMGYSVLEEDWWQGGYEASGTLWGPRQGVYLADFVIRAFDAFVSGGTIRQPPPWEPFEVAPYQRYAAAQAIGMGEVLTDVLQSYGRTDVVTVEVAGGDPWLGAPLAFLETADGEPVKRPGGQPIDSDGYHFWIDLSPEPPYAEQAAERRFRYSLSMPVSRQHAVRSPLPFGSYRIRVELPMTAGTTTTVYSSPFDIVE
jgi:hypothetical protein